MCFVAVRGCVVLVVVDKMVSYVANSRKPIENIHQEMDFARGRPPNPHLDIVLPSYLIEFRVLKSLQHEQHDYTLDYLMKCPTNSTRFFFYESYTTVKPLEKKIEIGSLFYFACVFRSVECMRVLMEKGARPLQPSFDITWGTTKEGDRSIDIIEAPGILCIAHMLFMNDLKVVAKAFKYIKTAELDLNTPFSSRRQHLQQPNPPATKTTQFKDIWEGLERELEKTPGPGLVEAKVALKKIRSAYNTDKLDLIIEKPNKGHKKVKSEGVSETKPKPAKAETPKAEIKAAEPAKAQEKTSEEAPKE